MSNSFDDDLEYLVTVINLTLVFLSLAVIYKQKVMEGIILLSFSCQFFLFWLLIKKYNLFKDIELVIQIPKLKKSVYYLNLAGCIGLFIVGIIFLFRALAIVQHSYINYNNIRTEFNYDILFSVVIGFTFIAIFFILFVTGKKFLKKNEINPSPTAIGV